MKIVILPEGLKQWYQNLMQPVVDFFIDLELNPNFFTTIGFVLSLVAAYLFGAGHLRVAGAFVLIAGTFDIIDGKVARATNRVTKFGALYDSTLDRYSEVIIFFGLAYYFVRQAWLGSMDPYIAFIASVGVSVALGGSIMVSYVRARAEGLGFECNIGIMQRPERIVSIGISSLFHQYVLILAIIIIAIFANYTAMQRLFYVWKKENGTKLKDVSN